MNNDLSELVDFLSRGRKYASFFEWPDKEQKELGVTEELITTLNATESLGLKNLTICRPDPPDITCSGARNERVAIEVSEIVCRDAVKANQKGQEVFRIWAQGELQFAIADRLSRKDKCKLHGAPYERFYACLFTDEMMLTHDGVAVELADAKFGPFEQITDAFLLFSYQSSTQSYPVLRLSVAEGKIGD
jgi:hypothetical protein